MVATEGEVFERLAAFPVWAACHVAAVDREHVEHDQHHLAALAVEHPIAEARDARQALIPERDQFAINRETIR